MAIVTISRQEACRGEEVAAEVARRLGWRLVDRPLMRELLYSYDLLAAIGRMPEGTGAGGRRPGEEQRAVREATEGIIWHLAFRESIVLLGFGGQFLFAGCPGTIHVRLTASLEHRLATAAAQARPRSAASLQRLERERRRIVRRESGEDLQRPDHYDVHLRLDTLGVHGAATVVERAVEAAGLTRETRLGEIRSCALERGAREIPLDPLPAGAAAGVTFANRSEEEFAKVLDFYRIPWRYEPDTFPVEWWPDGSVKSSFTPDFHLPELDTYLELTTMKQALVTKKNRKVRLFREHYPDKKLLIFYGRDFRRLARKFGLE